MTQKEFEQKWHRKYVRCIEGHWQIPEGIYWVGGALANWDTDGVHIFSIFGQGGNLTIHVAEADLPYLDEQFIVEEQ